MGIVGLSTEPDSSDLFCLWRLLEYLGNLRIPSTSPGLIDVLLGRRDVQPAGPAVRAGCSNAAGGHPAAAGPAGSSSSTGAASATGPANCPAANCGSAATRGRCGPGAVKRPAASTEHQCYEHPSAFRPDCP